MHAADEHVFPVGPYLHALDRSIEVTSSGNPFAAARLTRDPAAMAHGTVKFFKPDKGWGAVTSADLPGGFDAWVHFSVIEMDGYHSLNAGDPVEFDYEPAEQDSFRFVATRVRKL